MVMITILVDALMVVEYPRLYQFSWSTSLCIPISVMSATTATASAAAAAAARLEVERKIALSSSAEVAAFLSKLGAPVRRVVLHDTYWDDHEMSLVRKDQWLRLRNGGWEMKVPGISNGSHNGSSIYNELEGENNVKEVTQIYHNECLSRSQQLQFLFPSVDRPKVDLRHLLDQRGFKVFAELTSDRTTYHAVQDGRTINVDVDSATFPNDPVPYSIIELEVLSEASTGDADGDEKTAASDAIIDDFMDRMGIAGKTVRPRSKLAEYLARHDRKRLTKLAEASPKYRNIVCQLMGSEWVDEHVPQ
ncbi:hypothetical protein FOL46_002484 [Perkinsus olseni]|uniref:Thiamine-triphosphatase n=1 Tax=Perkinsus olseni TaxID=32597 RepID=A0A7J6MUE8_PEROL|nr:hypothetical protein FOL46_002484 [Perkinsus olseni]